MKHAFTIPAALIALLLFVTPFASAADRKTELRDRFKERFPQIAALKSAGKVGETSTGTVEAVKGDLNKDESKLVGEENADRSELYQIFAKENDTTAAKVASIEGSRRIKELKKGEYYKDDKGWHQKH